MHVVIPVRSDTNPAGQADGAGIEPGFRRVEAEARSTRLPNARVRRAAKRAVMQLSDGD